MRAYGNIILTSANQNKVLKTEEMKVKMATTIILAEGQRLESAAEDLDGLDRYN